MKKFVATINLADAEADMCEEKGTINIVGSKTSGRPFIWIGPAERSEGSLRATVEPKSMDAVCKAWIALRKLRGEWGHD